MLDNLFEKSKTCTAEILDIIKKEFQVCFWSCNIDSRQVTFPVINITIIGTNEKFEDVKKLLKILKSLDVLYLNPFNSDPKAGDYKLFCDRGSTKPSFNLEFIFNIFAYKNETLADFVEYLMEEDEIRFEKICKGLEFLEM